MFIRSFSLVLCLGLLLSTGASAFPALTYSTYLRDGFTPSAIATDAAGNTYLAGNAIIDPSTQQTTVLVVKLNPQATAYIYTRYIGGSVSDSVSAIAVDGAGNAYIAGSTTSPDFPQIGGNFATPPGASSERSFVAKLDPNGDLVYSDLLGASVNSFALAVAVNAAGQALVSGTSVDKGFPSTAGVFNVSDTSFVPYLIEIDPTGTKLVFSATGIGGNSLAFDSAGNIYMAGTTNSLTYPTTPGSYQPKFPVFLTCFPPCGGQFQGPNQYVTKLDPTGTKIIFSTALSGSGNTTNLGLAIDAQQNVYLTGLAGESYPYTVLVPKPPAGPALDLLATPALPFLSKLDSTGAKLLYSVPVGGAGVQVDANGVAYVGGVLGVRNNYDVAATLPALANLPSACLLGPVTTAGSPAYAAQVDSSGKVSGTKFLGGSALLIKGVALTGSTLWMAGTTNFPDFPFTANALTSGNLKPTVVPGAYLGAVDFAGAQPAAGTPEIACVVDAADELPTGPIVPNQLLTIFGSGLGPAKAVAATNNTTASLGGVSVSVGSHPAPLLYVSANQINLAVPSPPVGPQVSLTVSVNGVPSAPLTFPVTAENPRLFSVLGDLNTTFRQFIAVALNADGSVNSSTNPAKLGSVISVFANGFANPNLAPPQLITGSGWSISGVSLANPFVLDVQLRVPATTSNMECPAPKSTACLASFGVSDLNSFFTGGLFGGTGVVGFSGLVYVAP
ncbi:MAG TPA: SBBP repeat-containing protein [Bryobacteraceae bacterium]|nr:SBBP repeat-containing protein [Bryobacteraceae bacterium]